MKRAWTTHQVEELARLKVKKSTARRLGAIKGHLKRGHTLGSGSRDLLGRLARRSAPKVPSPFAGGLFVYHARMDYGEGAMNFNWSAHASGAAGQKSKFMEAVEEVADALEKAGYPSKLDDLIYGEERHGGTKIVAVEVRNKSYGRASRLLESALNGRGWLWN